MPAPESTASSAPGVIMTMMQLRIFWRRAARIPSAPVNVGCLGFIVIPSVFSVNRFLPVHSYFPLPLPLYFHGFETQNSLKQPGPTIPVTCVGPNGKHVEGAVVRRTSKIGGWEQFFSL